MSLAVQYSRYQSMTFVPRVCAQRKYFTVTIMQTYGNSIQSMRKFRVHPLAGELEKTVIRDGPLVNL